MGHVKDPQRSCPTGLLKYGDFAALDVKDVPTIGTKFEIPRPLEPIRRDTIEDDMPTRRLRGRGVLWEAPSHLQGRSCRCVLSGVGHGGIYVYEKKKRGREVEHPMLIFHRNTISSDYVTNRSEPFQALSPRDAFDGVLSWLAFVIFFRCARRRTKVSL